MAEAERVVAAALQHRETGIVLSLPRPDRHAHVIGLSQNIPLSYSRSVYTEGFLTSEGRFVGREQARLLAVLAGQVDGNNTRQPNVLFSEDLW